MRELSSDLLERLRNATPEKFATVERTLGIKPDEGEGHEIIHRIGRLRHANEFADVWLGEDHFDLRARAKARACIRYLVDQSAFDASMSRHLEEEIDPFVREHCQLPALPGYGELKIHHYFNPSTSEVARLGRELIQPAGRNRRYFLKVK